MRKYLFLLLLAAILGIIEGRKDELWCYQCENQRSHVNCEKLQKCSEGNSYCFKSEAHGKFGDYLLSKGCSPVCAPVPVYVASPVSNSTECCQTSFCNGSESTIMKTSHVVMAVGILVSFLHILQSRL